MCVFIAWSFLPHRPRLASTLAPYVGRTVNLAERITCKGFPARRFVPDHDRKGDNSSRWETRKRRCLALAHFRFLDNRPATATTDTGIFHFIQSCLHDVGVVA